jgi:hypothetical protein
MFDKVSQVAEKLATNVSRRAFLGRLGRGALVLAGAMGAMLAFPGLGQAHGCANGPCPCCCYLCPDGTVYTVKADPQGTCKKTYKGCPFASTCGCPSPFFRLTHDRRLTKSRLHGR